MKFAYASDLHLEFYYKRTDWDFKKIFKNPGDVNCLLLAGDILSVAYMTDAFEQTEQIVNMKNYISEFFEYVNSEYSDVVLIMGNHEHYFGRIDKTYNNLIEFVSHLKNITVIEDDIVVIPSENGRQKVTVIGSTLWTDFNNMEDLEVLGERSMNDYVHIKKGPDSNLKSLRAADTVAAHHTSLLKIREYVDACNTLGMDAIIMTHHAPSYLSVGKRFEGSPLNAAFASNLDWLLDELGKGDIVKYWIHGHMHDDVYYEFGNMKVLANPNGYPNERYRQNQPDFKLKFIEV